MSTESRPQGEAELQVAHENFVLSILISALNDNPAYAESDSCRVWLDAIGVKDQEAVKDALLSTGGKVKDKRYIAERMED